MSGYQQEITLLYEKKGQKDGRKRTLTAKHRKKISESILKHKLKPQSYSVDIPAMRDCPCGRVLFDHPNLPNSERIAVDMFCPFLQMQRLGVL